MHHANIHEDNAALFKCINDLAVNQGQWSKREFIDYFLNNGYFLDPKNYSSEGPPSMDSIVRLYEHLDENKDGILEAEDFYVFMTNVDRLKKVNFEVKNFTRIDSDDSQKKGSIAVKTSE